MGTQIFVNLPVKDLAKSIAFFTRLGYTFNPQFTNDDTTCMIVSADIFVMLLTENFFQSFTPKAICDATKSTEMLLCLSAESRENVDTIVSTAIAAGGTLYKEPRDHGFQDLDGHIWEYCYMEPGAVCQG